MSVSDPEEKIEWRADSEPWKNERVPSSGDVSFHWTTEATKYNDPHPGYRSFADPSGEIYNILRKLREKSQFGKNLIVQ
jgi:hypothetical protein